MQFRGFLAGGAVALALTLTACGGGSTTTTTAPAGGEAPTKSVQVPGTELKFDLAQIDAEAGKPFKVKLTNNGNVQHNLIIKDAAGSPAGGVPAKDTTQYLDPGQSKTSDAVTLAAGEYEFYCSFPGHETTMQGKVVVK